MNFAASKKKKKKYMQFLEIPCKKNFNVRSKKTMNRAVRHCLLKKSKF